MKLTRVEKLYLGTLVVIFGGIVIHAPLSVGLSTIFPHFSTLIKSWKEILMGIALILLIVIATKRKLWQELFNDGIIRLIAVFALLNVFLVFVLYHGASEAAAGLAIDLRFALYFVLVYAAVRIAPQWRHLMVKVGIIGAVVVVGFATLQLFLPRDILSYIGYNKGTIEPYLTVDKNLRYIRENSTLRGPNPLGAYAGMVLAFVVAFVVRKRDALKDKKVRYGLIAITLCSIVAVWVSYSRSALIAAILAVLVALLASYIRRIKPKMWLGAGAVAVLLVVGLVLTSRTSFVSNVILHINPNGGSATNSNQGHISSLEMGWNQLVHQPLGAGVGSTGSASLFGGTPDVIENQYLFVAHESGWLGLVIFVALFVLILVRLWNRRGDWLTLGAFASGLGLAFIGLLLPVWVDDTVSIVWWGLAALALGGEYARNKAK